jgi:cysteinyl-tRNA synthetase
MQKLIGNLVDNGLAYKAANEDMCYAVRKFEGYGKLSGKSSTSCVPASASRWRVASTIRWILCCGSTPVRKSPTR